MGPQAQWVVWWETQVGGGGALTEGTRDQAELENMSLEGLYWAPGQGCFRSLKWKGRKDMEGVGVG